MDVEDKDNSGGDYEKKIKNERHTLRDHDFQAVLGKQCIRPRDFFVAKPIQPILQRLCLFVKFVLGGFEIIYCLFQLRVQRVNPLLRLRETLILLNFLFTDLP